MSNRKSSGLKLFPAMFKYECLVRLLAYVFMAVWYHYGIVMNVCWIMGDSAGDTNGFEFSNCHAVVRDGRKLTYPPALTHLSSVLSPLCKSHLLGVRGGVAGESSASGQVWNKHYGAACLGFEFASIWTKNKAVQTFFFSFLILDAYL